MPRLKYIYFLEGGRCEISLWRWDLGQRGRDKKKEEESKRRKMLGQLKETRIKRTIKYRKWRAKNVAGKKNKK